MGQRLEGFGGPELVTDHGLGFGGGPDRCPCEARLRRRRPPELAGC
jgi:hypothetical protein